MEKNVLKAKNYTSIGRKFFTKTVAALAFVLLSNTMFSQVGAALDFDGINDKVTIPALPAMSELTIESWVYLNAIDNTFDTIINNDDWSTGDIHTHVLNGKFYFGINGNNPADTGSTTTAVANTWYHIAYVYSSTAKTLKIYINGNLDTTRNYVTAISNRTMSRTIGAWQGGRFFNGKLDEMRIWNRALSQCEIQNNMNGELASGQVGLVAYYNFNQGIASGNNATITTLTDSSGNANTGTLNSFVLTGTTSNWITPGGVATGTTSPAFSLLLVASPQTFCAGATVADLVATGTALKWYNVATAGTVLATTTALVSGTYYVSQTTGTCESPRTAVTVTITTTAVPTAITPQTFDTGATVNDLTATGTNLKWYAASTGGVALVNTTSLATGLYYVSQTISGCESTRTIVQVNINGAGLDFDGVDDQINFGNTITTVLSGTNKLTVEAWVKTTNTTGLKTIISNHGNGSATQFDLRTNGTNFDCFVGFGTYVVTAGTVIPNTWQHVAMIFDGATLKLYVNGVNVGTTNTSSYTLQASTSPIIMGNNGYAEIFQGKMDEVRVWNRALPEAEIQNNMNCELGSGQTGLVAYYKFNQGFDNANNATTTTLTDSSGNANTGTLNNFALNGATSNFVDAGAIATGVACTAYTLSAVGFNTVSGLSVYPNPSSGVFFIESNANGTVVVNDLQGKTIQSQKIISGTSQLNLSHVSNGVYLLKITNDKNESKTMKLIKK